MLHNLGFNNNQIRYKLNTFQPTERVAYNVPNKHFIQVLIAKLNAGKRCVVFCGSKTLLEKIKGNVIEHTNIPESETAYYMGNENGSTFENVREEWSNKKLVAYTPTITVGVNFNTKGVFDCLFV